MLFWRANFATSLIFLMESVVVLQIKVGDAVARRGRHGFLASGAALVLRFVLVEAVIGAGPSLAGRPAVLRLWTVLWCYKFEAGALPASCACKHCLCAMRTSELSHTQDQCFKQHRALGTCPKNRGAMWPLVPLSCYGARTGAGRNASPGAGRDGLGGARAVLGA